MFKPVLQTRQIGLRTHFSGHPLAPMEIVYEVEKPPGFWLRLWRLSPGKKFTLVCLGYAIYVFGAAISQVAGWLIG